MTSGHAKLTIEVQISLKGTLIALKTITEKRANIEYIDHHCCMAFYF